MDDFVTVFLFTESTNIIALKIENGKSLGFFLLIIGLAGILFLVFDSFILQRKRSDNNLSSFISVEKRLISSFGFLIIFGVIWVILIPDSYTLYDSKYLHLLKIYETKQYEISEGVVQILHPELRVIKDIIRINGIDLEVDSYSDLFGYKSGVLTDGVYARVFYIKSLENDLSRYTILRVDIRK